ILSDRIAPRSILIAGIGLLVVADLVLANADNWWIVGLGVVLWGGHMALSQGIFSRMIADAAGDEGRASSFGAFFFVSGFASLLASLGAGLIWDRDGPAATFMAGAVLAAIAGAMALLLPSVDPPGAAKG
ncbi:MAG: MFS transporter, partial [Pseudomonadota bacterium]|nr:MFS transporter [Pseudomonadota bacterium]